MVKLRNLWLLSRVVRCVKVKSPTSVMTFVDSNEQVNSRARRKLSQVLTYVVEIKQGQYIARL